MPTLRPAAQNVQNILHALGYADLTVVEFAESTRTSAEAAAAVGCEVGQIAKSLVFRAKQRDAPVLVIASGANRVDEKKVRDLLGETIGKADADFVRARTGFVIGGVAPVGHSQPLTTVIDDDLLTYDEIWAAAGTPFAVFKLRPAQLVEMTGGTVGEIKLVR